MDLFQSAFVYLLAAVVAVPIAKRLGLGSVLGYLIAGIVIGPMLGFVGSEAEEVKHFAEFGVVMMLFLVGLELQPAILWRMRNKLIGLGGLQVLITTGAFTAVALMFGQVWQSALAIGMTLALSSTAIVLQTLNEKGLMASPGGQSSFSVLLFQDIAVIPMLAVMPLLAVVGFHHGDASGGHGSGGALSNLPGWLQTLAILGVISAIIIGGRYLIRPVFRFIAAARLREVFTAAALLLVVGIALLMDTVGLSPALGTFVAGVVLSDSEYRHELESDIDPFKGLLLGLFFISVGAGIDFGLIFGSPATIFGLALAVMAIKFAILFFLSKVFRIPKGENWLFALGLAQAGEFAFVLFGFAQSAGAVPTDTIRVLTLVVAITMLLTPLLFIFYDKVIAPRAAVLSPRDADDIDEKGTVVVAGVGRFGQVTTRLLLSNGYKVVILDYDPEMTEALRRIGLKTYYGDASRPDLLHAAGLDDAKMFVAAMDDKEQQVIVVDHVARTYPHCKIIARAYDRHHAYELYEAGAHVVERETFEAALNLGKQALIELGEHPFQAELKAKAFRRHDKETMRQLHENWKDGGVDQSYIENLKARGDQLYSVMRLDSESREEDLARAWVPAPKSDALADLLIEKGKVKDKGET
ncbi:potassium transporter [Rhodobacteraceae bacterium RKSG542]|uniref:monovalent cation:proton antiporter-2 (CPA2) family protein n=1 Tax=Pseudovibrio flavus TaxID=2529854 RepID=UPI0012BBEB19|nr:monovalent cation:proton antiporter-2 (CPA2) family protein [Pseudovibrio flavus]MTI18105.1 potassium transporter [Pseudovibrio flavus]